MGGLFNARCKSTMRLDGKTAIITGANSGIGKCTAKDFYKRGARVILACRSLSKAEEAVNNIHNETLQTQKYLLGELIVVQLDLASFASIRICATKLLERESRIDLLINNAGVMLCPESRTLDGYELQFGTNHLGHFLLTMLLLPKIVASAPARIVNVSSMAHSMILGTFRIDDLNWTKRKYDPQLAYFESKLCNVLFTKELARKLEDANIAGVTTYALHPGVVATELFRHMDTTFPLTSSLMRYVGQYLCKNSEEGAQTTIYCAVDEQAEHETGLYYVECKVKNSGSKSKNELYGRKLWEISLEMVGLENNYDPFNLNWE